MNTGNIEGILRKFGSEEVPREIHKIAEEQSQKFTETLTAAVIRVTILGGINFWPRDGSGNDKWWIGPSAAWGEEIIRELEKVEALISRQRALRVKDYGPDTMGSLWEMRYAAKDRYRKDILDGTNNIISTEWILPGGQGFMKYQIWPEYQCYTKKSEKTPPLYDNTMLWLRRWVRFLGKAERILGTQNLEGRECVGFEINPGTYEGFFVQVPVHIWFDVETKLPVRVERRGLPVDYDPAMKLTLIYDQFDYYTQVPTDMFTPDIPEGFVNAEPDEIIAAREGEMVFADVPEELRDEIFSALKEVQTVVYQEHLEWTTADGETHTYGPRNMYLARDGWREDSYKWETPRETKWYVIEKEEHDAASFEFNEQSFKLIETVVNFTDETYRATTYEGISQHRHPIDRILFLAGLVNRADRVLENIEIEGIECFGVEVSANKYGDNSPDDKHRMWFDRETKLPVRMEFEYSQSDGKTRSIRIRDQFQWDPELPPDTFVPEIPNGFSLISDYER
jgi:outer membrane lipoprotein-sorting protein